MKFIDLKPGAFFRTLNSYVLLIASHEDKSFPDKPKVLYHFLTTGPPSPRVTGARHGVGVRVPQRWELISEMW